MTATFLKPAEQADWQVDCHLSGCDIDPLYRRPVFIEHFDGKLLDDRFGRTGNIQKYAHQGNLIDL